MSTPVSSERLWPAVVAATSAACVTAFLSGFVYAAQFGAFLDAIADRSFYQVGVYVGLIAMTVTVFACPFVFTIVGLPMFRLSLRLRWVRAWQYVLVGFGVSCLAAIGVFFALPLDRHFAVPLTIVSGTVATLTFWFVVRPDDGPTAATS